MAAATSTSPMLVRAGFLRRRIITVPNGWANDPEHASSSMKAWVSVFYNTFSTIVLDCSVALYGHPGYILDVEMLQAPAAVRDALNASVRHQGAALHT